MIDRISFRAGVTNTSILSPVFDLDRLLMRVFVSSQATSRVCGDKFRNAIKGGVRRTASVGDLESPHNTSIIIS